MKEITLKVLCSAFPEAETNVIKFDPKDIRRLTDVGSTDERASAFIEFYNDVDVMRMTLDGELVKRGQCSVWYVDATVKEIIEKIYVSGYGVGYDEGHDDGYGEFETDFAEEDSVTEIECEKVVDLPESYIKVTQIPVEDDECPCDVYIDAEKVQFVKYDEDRGATCIKLVNGILFVKERLPQVLQSIHNAERNVWVINNEATFTGID